MKLFFNICKSLLFTFLVPGTVVVLLPWLLLGSSWPDTRSTKLQDFLSGAFFSGGLITYSLTVWQFIRAKGTPAPIDPPKELVFDWYYRFSRNPMYISILSFLICLILSFGKMLLVYYTMAVAVGFHLWIIFYEEPNLQKRFGQAYVDYCSRVSRWITLPFFKKNNEV